MKSALDLSEEELRKLWKTWINDSSLKSELRFGQFVCNRKLPKMSAWPDCYYADTEKAYNLLYKDAMGVEPARLTFFNVSLLPQPKDA